MNIQNLIKQSWEQGEKKFVCDKCDGTGKAIKETNPRRRDDACGFCNGTGSQMSIPNQIMEINYHLVMAWRAGESLVLVGDALQSLDSGNSEERRHVYKGLIEYSRPDHLAAACIRLFELIRYKKWSCKKTNTPFDKGKKLPISDSVNKLVDCLYRGSYCILIEEIQAICQYHSIPLEKHILARLAFEKEGVV